MGIRDTLRRLVIEALSTEAQRVAQAAQHQAPVQKSAFWSARSGGTVPAPPHPYPHVVRGSAEPLPPQERAVWLLHASDPTAPPPTLVRGTGSVFTPAPIVYPSTYPLHELQGCTPVFRNDRYAPVALCCDACGHISPGDARFCVECGHDFRPERQAPATPAPATGPTRRLP